ncbi:hypothetical protein FOPG_10083 [Fusarium oxysporum f. sp. conglutinans race 2 54008]|uniref:Uncharacterized protein n=1 Tax=Fusarium oxysporum f. sp. conglutinans race 2 54008 TaxID=1089457 RepID=X0IP31_FUSOX|nr:hypothetical protein FOPG_10083 [Fusarium oxysporum f. sp. conglutinans race 2 54008]
MPRSASAVARDLPPRLPRPIVAWPALVMPISLVELVTDSLSLASLLPEVPLCPPVNHPRLLLPLALQPLLPAPSPLIFLTTGPMPVATLTLPAVLFPHSALHLPRHLRNVSPPALRTASRSLVWSTLRSVTAVTPSTMLRPRPRNRTATWPARAMTARCAVLAIVYPSTPAVTLKCTPFPSLKKMTSLAIGSIRAVSLTTTTRMCSSGCTKTPAATPPAT